MTVRTIEWIGKAPDGRVLLIDQTELPQREVMLERTDYLDLAGDIRRLAVRGAPAIGVAGAFGVVLGVQKESSLPREEFDRKLDEVCELLDSTRPTAVNLSWAIGRMRSRASAVDRKAPVQELIVGLESEALAICEQDRALCRSIGDHGADLIPEGARILTHCNAGALATAGIGTALAPVYVARERGLEVSVYADETRPLLQGSRLTAWELSRSGVPVTVICDNMAASLMKKGMIDLVITGADRIAANGDVANKIGTYGVACLAEKHGVPFHVAAPHSTFDLSLPDGSGIPIEQRDSSEVKRPGGLLIAPEEVDVINPAFDVTPGDMVASLITDKGIIEPPYVDNIPRVLGS